MYKVEKSTDSIKPFRDNKNEIISIPKNLRKKSKTKTDANRVKKQRSNKQELQKRISE